MDEVKKEAEEIYAIMQNETMVLSGSHCEALGWEEGKTRVFVYVDQKRGLLYVVDREDYMGKLPTDQFVCAKPIVGKTFQISFRRAIQVIRGAREYLGLEIGDRMVQNLNLTIHGIVAKKVEESNG